MKLLKMPKKSGCGTVLVWRPAAKVWRSRGDYQGPERPCEISDIERIVKYLRRQGKLRLRQLNTMYRWGAMHCSPYYDRRAGRIEVRLWDEGLRCLEPLLRSKGIIIAEEE